MRRCCGEGRRDREVLEGLSVEVTLIVKYEGQEEVGHAKNAPKPRTRALQTEDAADAEASGGIPGWLEHDRREGETRDAISEVGRGPIVEGFSGEGVCILL